ncbi:MAG: CRISPR-associated endonuclease Cas2, partial [Oscillospiraceae bacterium]
MRVIIFFDLPMMTGADVKNYTKFRKFLVKEGFIMLQKSVYTKLAINSSTANLVKTKLEKNKPQEGLVQMLTVTEKQFAGMENITGVYKKNT